MKKFKFLYIAAAALLFAACANEEDGIGNNGPVAATVQADIVKNATRATTGKRLRDDAKQCKIVLLRYAKALDNIIVIKCN